MSKVYRSAQGRMVDIEKLRLANEETIAVGNMKVNARGDQLGPGGRVVKTRNQIMKEYYNLNTPTSIPSVTQISPTVGDNKKASPVQESSTKSRSRKTTENIDEKDNEL
jgi:hypothetical protein